MRIKKIIKFLHRDRVLKSFSLIEFEKLCFYNCVNPMVTLKTG